VSHSGSGFTPAPHRAHVDGQVQALRSVEPYLNLEKLYVLGTNCVDNGPRKGLDTFLKAASSTPQTVLHYEFMQASWPQRWKCQSGGRGGGTSLRSLRMNFGLMEERGKGLGLTKERGKGRRRGGGVG